jgi:5'-nucleotidase
MRILVTNDDGIDSPGLHVLAREMGAIAETVVVAPDREFSGAGASIGPLHLLEPEAERRVLGGVDEAWALDGPPALAVLLARVGAFGEPFDLVVSGINPGCNVGRAVYHSGTVGAVLTARNGAMSGIAVSQAVDSFSFVGQEVVEEPTEQRWHTAAHLAGIVARGLLESPPEEPVAVNLNVGNVELHELKGWKRRPVASPPLVRSTTASLEPLADNPDRFAVKFAWSKPTERAPGPDSDTQAVADGYVAVNYLNHLGDDAAVGDPGFEAGLDALFS